MRREEALKTFRQEQEEPLSQCRQQFLQRLPDSAPELMKRITGAFAAIRSQAETLGREKSVYFQFSLLCCDLLARNYTMLLQVQDIRWYLDTAPMETTFSVDFLYEGFDRMWEQLLTESRRYVEKINSYDVDSMMRETVLICNRAVGDALRYFLRDVEENPEFAAIPREAVWDIRWGEYRGDSSLAARADRIPKSLTEWLTALRKDIDRAGLRESYWYQATLTEGDCSKRNMAFAVFEDCRLSGLDFSETDLTGVRFRNCLIEHCRFDFAVLDTAFFEHCHFTEPSLCHARMDHAVFTKGGLPWEAMDEEQLGAALVKEGREETE